MSTFEYAMVLISIIVGLGVTHTLSSIANAVPRMRGHGPPIRLELTYLTWVAVLFVWVVTFWWFEFKWRDLAPEFGIGLFLFLVLYAVSLFSLVVILVPDKLSVVDDSWAYFLSIRRWFYGGLLALNVIDFVDTFMKGVDWGLRLSYLSFFALLTAAAIVGLTTTRRGLHLGFGTAVFIGQLAITVYDQAILGRW